MQDAAANEKSDPAAWFLGHHHATGKTVQTSQAVTEKNRCRHKIKHHRCTKLNYLSVTMSTVRPDEWLARNWIFSRRRRAGGLRDIPRKNREIGPVSVKLVERPLPLTSAGTSPAGNDVKEAPAVSTSSEHAPETLWGDGELILSRGPRYGEPFPLLAATPSSLQPSPETLGRLQHAYALREELDPAWAARPLRLELQQGRLTLLMEDPGGESLLKLLGRPLEIMSFLRLAIGIATALAQVHHRGLIHKDIKPANVLVNCVTGQVWLMGFGIASRLPRERQAAAPPEVIAGTLAYMAPEQTGRMNRSIDFRSDLYALGVTLYEMLTGELPFAASDPMAWVHCHIARQPMPPDKRVAGIPGPLSGIVMKLLAKTAEDRYQTAAGLTADLRKCLAEWESHRSIEPFPLGADDVSDRLMAPEKLYGREHEIERLLGAFDRVVTNGATELVLVSGYAGIGKSSVVNELQRALVAQRGLFASGKFDQFKRDIPYATLAQAFRSLVRPVLGESEVELSRWRDSFSEAVGLNGQLIVNLIPELELIIGTQPSAWTCLRRTPKTAFKWCSSVSSAYSCAKNTHWRCSSTTYNGWMPRRSISLST
jgi:serine/threonine protein kinase